MSVQSPDRIRQGALLERTVRDRWRGAGGIRGLSKALGVSRATLYSWFRGDTSPNAHALSKLANVLDVTPSRLIAPEEPAESRSVRRALAESPVAWDAEPRSRPIGQVIAGQEVAWCDADEPIGPVAHRMYELQFSQAPVRDRGRWAALLTEETIARWMAGRSRHGLDVDERAPVREVLAYAEDPDNYHLVGPDTPADQVGAAFRERSSVGQPLVAVLVATGGNPEGEIVGIVTQYDLPRLS